MMWMFGFRPESVKTPRFDKLSFLIPTSIIWVLSPRYCWKFGHTDFLNAHIQGVCQSFIQSIAHILYVSSLTVLAHSQIMHFELFTGVSEFFPHRTAFTSTSLRSRLNYQISVHWPWRLTMMIMTSYSASWERYQSQIWKPTATRDAPIQWSISAGANRLAVNVGP